MTFGHFFLDRTFQKEYNMFWINDQQSFLERRSFMQKVSKRIVQFRIPILIIALILLIPSVIGYIRTRVNYDMLDYIDTLRIEHAIKLLDEQKEHFRTDDQDDMSRLAHQCGYLERSVFERSFQKVMQTSLKDYRQ